MSTDGWSHVPALGASSVAPESAAASAASCTFSLCWAKLPRLTVRARNPTRAVNDSTHRTSTTPLSSCLACSRPSTRCPSTRCPSTRCPSPRTLPTGATPWVVGLGPVAVAVAIPRLQALFQVERAPGGHGQRWQETGEGRGRQLGADGQLVTGLAPALARVGGGPAGHRYRVVAQREGLDAAHVGLQVLAAGVTGPWAIGGGVRQHLMVGDLARPLGAVGDDLGPGTTLVDVVAVQPGGSRATG